SSSWRAGCSTRWPAGPSSSATSWPRAACWRTTSCITARSPAASPIPGRKRTSALDPSDLQQILSHHHPPVVVLPNAPQPHLLGQRRIVLRHEGREDQCLDTGRRRNLADVIGGRVMPDE